ncbi:MAG: archaellin/type IV pilin N-terminal domain-containing protein [Candidatus Bathyarchaeia archaeon]
MRGNRVNIGRKIVSPVVATLLLVIITVVASVIIWTWVSNMVGQKPSQVIVDKVVYIDRNTLGVTIRNIGATTVRIGDVNIKVGGLDWDSKDDDDIIAGDRYVDLPPGRILVVEVKGDEGSPDIRIGDRIIVVVLDDSGNKIFMADVTVI